MSENLPDIRDEPAFWGRVGEFVERIIAATPADVAAECRSRIESGLAPAGVTFRPTPGNPETASFMWAGVEIGRTTWDYLSTGRLPSPDDLPGVGG